ncbi:MAG TPA: DUF3089 domain-containing protein [Polyangiaceae bacterium]|jgi:hypothetical protein
MAFLRFAPLLLAPALLGCAIEAPPPQAPPPPSNLQAPFTGFQSRHYGDPSSWLCLPGRNDACAADLTATELRPDGSRVVVRDEPKPGSDEVDCFYVYPTVDMRMYAANHEDFSDLSAITRATVGQVARFRNVCRLYVPLYRQTTFGSYFQSEEARRPYRDVAVSDVVDAFLEYMGQYNHGHKIVLVGHSQGAEMTIALMKRLFDDDPVMRAKLLIAMPIGWGMDVLPGQATGGTFHNIPMCTKHGETGCVIGYRSYVGDGPANVGKSVPSPGHDSLCVNPAELAHGKATFSRSYFGRPPPPLHLIGVEDVSTFFVMLRDYYAGQCVEGPNGLRYLAVTEAPVPGDRRVSPIDLSLKFFHGVLGLHLLDMHFPQGDLVDLVAERAAAVARAPSPAPPAPQTGSPQEKSL